VLPELLELQPASRPAANTTDNTMLSNFFMYAPP
jgi:hypothetical protein